METSIEALLSRKRETEEVHPFAKRLYAIPTTRPVIRAWYAAFGEHEPKAQWVNLPRVVA